MGKHLRLRARDQVHVGPVTLVVLRTGREVAVRIDAPADTKITHAKACDAPTIPFRPAPAAGAQTGIDPAA